ncbi:hypothetical protein HU200_013929 [Digitaria exilis]|uniref:Uncharacterized protein n=1 Tax=Digitaria exilis TaxID=1010633 RepID=A0A835KKP4_9POAL|nr:hypothetical protein HU200_013929 [Digitaria exilis]
MQRSDCCRLEGDAQSTAGLKMGTAKEVATVLSGRSFLFSSFACGFSFSVESPIVPNSDDHTGVQLPILSSPGLQPSRSHPGTQLAAAADGRRPDDVREQDSTRGGEAAAQQWPRRRRSTATQNRRQTPCGTSSSVMSSPSSMQTTILSKRWLDLWHSVPAIDLDITDFLETGSRYDVNWGKMKDFTTNLLMEHIEKTPEPPFLHPYTTASLPIRALVRSQTRGFF